MLKIDTYSIKGTKLTPVSLPKEWDLSAQAGAKSNLALLAQAVHVYRDRSHGGLHQAQTRGEVNRTTKKWYKQKGTGGARHGARSAPIFVGGGKAHGPRALARELTLPDKMKKKALAVAITLAVKDNKVIAGELSAKKTSEIQKFINKVIERKKPRVTFVLAKKNLEVAKFIRNIDNTGVVVVNNLNAYDVFLGGKIIFDKSIFAKEKGASKK